MKKSLKLINSSKYNGKMSKTKIYVKKISILCESCLVYIVYTKTEFSS